MTRCSLLLLMVTGLLYLLVRPVGADDLLVSFLMDKRVVVTVTDKAIERSPRSRTSSRTHR